MELKNWNVMFRMEHGAFNRLSAVSSIVDFMGSAVVRKREFSHCAFSIMGKVYGHEKHSDGTEVITNKVSSIERVNDVDYDVITESGSRYRISMINASVYVCRMFEDFRKNGKLNESSCYYRDSDAFYDLSDYL